MKKARKYLNAGDLEESDYHTSLALRAYDKAMYNSSRIWRFSNIYAAPIWIYLVGFLGAVLAFYMLQTDQKILDINKSIAQDALYAATWGTVGSILRGLWFLKDKVTDRQYRNSFRIYFLTVPFLGALF